MSNKRQIKKPKGAVRFVDLASYTTPEVKEQKNRDWVEYGADNNYFQYLIDRYNGSPTNNAAINGISQMIYGRGIDATDSNLKPEQYAMMRRLLSDSCVMKLANDLKLFGQAAIQVIYNAERSAIVEADHFPVETLRPEKCNEDGEIEAYYYTGDWSELKPSEQPERIPAFGHSEEGLEILYIKPYRAGFHYFSPVDYQGGLQYAELEEEVGNYHLNNIMNGLAPSMLISFNNGVPDEEMQEQIEQKIKQKFGGSSNAGRFILAFNDSRENEASIEPVQLSDAHNQYQFLSEECMSKVMVSHRIISPLLLGIKDKSGLGNNADELKTASILMDNTVIRPFQQLLINAFEQILAYNAVYLRLYFRTLQPLEFVDLENAITKEQVEEETGQKLSLQADTLVIDGRLAYATKDAAEKAAEDIGCEGHHIHNVDGTDWFMPCEEHNLKAPCWDGYEQIGTKIKDGKEVPNCVPIKAEKLKEDCGCHTELKDADDPCWDGYEQIGTKIKDGKEVPNCVPLEEAQKLREAVYEALIGLEDEDLSDYELIDERPANEFDDILAKELNLASVVSSSPQKKSEQDTLLFKVRYKYAQVGTTSMQNSRDFCKMMMSAGKVYRKEDLDKQSTDNEQFAPKGSSSYNIWLYKGGVNCRHYWMRQVYIRKDNKKITVTEAKEKIRKLDPSLRKEAEFPTNEPEVAQIASAKNNYWRKN